MISRGVWVSASGGAPNLFNRLFQPPEVHHLLEDTRQRQQHQGFTRTASLRALDIPAFIGFVILGDELVRSAETIPSHLMH
jgi:hypothetical protein